MTKHRLTGRVARGKRTTGAVTGVLMLAAVAVLLPSAVAGRAHSKADTHGTKALWTGTSAALGANAKVRPDRARKLTLDRAGLAAALAAAPAEGTKAAKQTPLVVSLPAPNGSFQRFQLAESSIMAPGLAAKHPDIKTYAGVGIDDPTATIHADTSSLGFHASVRSTQGAWYIDPAGLRLGHLRQLLRSRPRQPGRELRRA